MRQSIPSNWPASFPRIGIAQVDRKRGEVQIRFMEQAAVDPQQLMRLVARNAKRGAQFTPDGTLKFILKPTAADEVLRALRATLEHLSAQKASEAV